jgi:hypothetical protein
MVAYFFLRLLGESFVAPQSAQIHPRRVPVIKLLLQAGHLIGVLSFLSIIILNFSNA